MKQIKKIDDKIEPVINNLELKNKLREYYLSSDFNIKMLNTMSLYNITYQVFSPGMFFYNKKETK